MLPRRLCTGKVTCPHDKLDRTNKEHKELHQIVAVFLLQTVSTMLAACGNNLSVVQAKVDVDVKQISVVAKVSNIMNGDHLGIRLLAILLLLKLSNEKVNSIGSLLLSQIIEADRGRNDRARAVSGFRGDHSLLVFLVTIVIRRVAADRCARDLPG